MKVLFLGSSDVPLVPYIAAIDTVTHTSDPITVELLEHVAPDWVVSYGYRHIIRPPEISFLKERIVNLHISLLPWNRGADPNLWSWIDETPKGVSIHYVDKGIDTGDLIGQREVRFTGGETLAQTYVTLKQEVESLFRELWPAIREGRAPRMPQPVGGSFHRVADRAAIEHLLSLGWDTPVGQLQRRS